MDKLISIFLFLSLCLTVNCQSIEKYLIKNEFKNSDTISYTDYKSEQMPTIYINQSNNLHIVAKYGQTVSLPCIIYKLKNQDLSQIHAVWHKLSDRQRATVLSIGNQQIKQDLRYRVKQVTLNKQSSLSTINNNNNEALSYDNEKLSETQDQANDPNSEYLVENWQFEIRKLTFEDAGTYQCLLPLIKPITRNVTLKILPEIVIDPKEKNFFANQKISINCRANVKLHHSHKNGESKRNHKPVLNWYKENELIRNRYNPNTKHKIEIQSENPDNHSIRSVLTIYNAREDDSGKYTCSFDNHSEQTRIVVLSEDFASTDMLSGQNNSNQMKSSYLICILTAFILIVML